MIEPPLLQRLPGLRVLPRASIGRYPTPVQRLTLDDGTTLLLKRDDLTAAVVGGNKVRGLEWLLGAVSPGDRVLTVGPRGSTHALATAVHAHALGATATVVRWNQEMNPAARIVDARLSTAARVIDARAVPIAYLVASALRVAPRVTWIPAGGSAPAALLGHVNAALELAEQVRHGEIEQPEQVVVPFGTGGTAAGLALGFRLAALATRVVAVRVVPRLLGRERRLYRLAARTAALIERVSGERLPRLAAGDLVVEHGFFGGAYGRPLESARDETALRAAGIGLDDTYSRKAFAAAAARAGAPTLLWLTFDGRLLQNGAL